MAGRVLPNLNLMAFYTPGESGWGGEMSLNLLKLSILTQGGVSQKVAAEPGAPTAGDVILLDETHATHPNAVAAYDNGAWVYFTPSEGWLVYDRGSNQYLWYNTIKWVPLVTGGSGGVNVTAFVSAATITPTFSDDLVKVTAQAEALTIANWSGVAVEGWGLVIRIKDNGTARGITFGTKYRAVGVTLPTTTVVGKVLYLAVVYNETVDKFDVIAVRQEA